MQTLLETLPPRFIVGIFPDGEEEAQCIRIAHPSRMYLTDDYIPTHNSWEPESESLERAATMPRQAFTFDQARKEAKKFQGRPLTNDNTRMVAHVSRDSLDKMLSEKSSDKSSSAAIHALAVANLDHLFKNAVPGWSKTDRDRDPNISALHRMFAPMRVGDDTKLVKLTVKEFTIPDQENKLYTVEAVDVEDGVSPVPEMVDADRTRGSRLLTGPTGLAESLVESIQKRNRENRSMESPLRRERAADQAAPASVDRQWAQELSALGQTMRRTRGSDQVKAVREQIVGKPLTNLETGIVATVSGESWRKMMSASNVDLSISPQAHMQALGNIDTLFRLATLEETRSGKKSVDAGTIIAIRHFVIPMPFDGDVLQVRIMAKEFSDVNQGNRLYLIEAVEIEGEATPASLIGAAVEGGSTSSRGGYPPRPAGVVDRFAQMVTLVKGENVSDDDLLYQQATPTPPAPPNPSSAWQKSKDKVSSLVSPRAIDALISTWQDKYVDLKRVREHIQKTDGALSDMNDAYTGENLSHQRIAKRHKDFLKDELEPLFKEMRQYGIEREAFEQFLHARHAPEANRVMARRNPNEEQIKAGQEAAEAKLKELRIQLQHAQARNSATRAIEQAIEKAQAEVTHWKTAEAFRGTEKERLSLSGMSDADAKALMDALSPAKRKKMESLAERIDAINAKTLTLLDSYGLMDSSSLDAWRSTYQYYVPLHRDEAHPEGFSHPIGSGFNVRGPAAKQRTGSNEKVTNILGHIAMQREAAITRGEKNRVDKMLFLLASQNPNPDFWTVNQPKRKKILENGLVRVRVDPNYRNQPNVLMLRIAGKEAYVTFNEHNPEAMRLAAALKNLDVSDMGVVTGLMFKLTRYFASINTQYNPLFGLRNFGRDTLFGLPAISSTELAGQQKQLFKETMRLLKEAFKAGFDLDSMDGKEKALWEEIQNVGGTTGYRDLYRDPNERTKALDRMLKEVDRGKIGKMAYRLGGWLSNYNEAMENIVRLAAYKIARDKGLSTTKAASIAKNLTVNFNRRGTMTRDMGAWFAFFNASVQGTARLIEILRSPAGKKILLGGIGLGFVQTVVAMSVLGSDDDDDDDRYVNIPEFVRERSLILPVSRSDYIAIPMPLGLHVLPNFGRMIAESLFGGEEFTPGKQAPKLLSLLLDAFNPLGSSQNLAHTLTPTPFEIPFSLLSNRDWRNMPIYREDFDSLHPTPGFTRAKDSASSLSTSIAKQLNRITGGTDYQPGHFSWTPDQLDYVVGQLTGGAGREALKAVNYIVAVVKGENDTLPWHKIPMTGGYYGSTTDGGAENTRFYENLRALNLHEVEIEGRAKNDAAVDDYIQENPESELIGLGSRAESRVTKLKKIRRQVLSTAEPGYKDEVREIDREISTVMREFNREVRNVRGR